MRIAITLWRISRLDSLDVDIPRVAKIFNRPWWRRVWTLQEGLAGSKDSLVLCGDKEIVWETVTQDIRYLLHPKQWKDTGYTSIIYYSTSRQFILLAKIHRE
jgi:hypothetical protein